MAGRLLYIVVGNNTRKDLLILEKKEIYKILKFYKSIYPNSKINTSDKEIIDAWFLMFEEYGNLTVTFHPIIDKESLLLVIEEKDYDVIVYEEAPYLFFKNRTKELIELAKELRRRGKIFIFVTHLKRRNNPFTHREKNAPSISRHSRAIPHFDATAIVYRNCYYEDFKKADEDIEEIRIYERGKKKYRAVPVEFDFQHQIVKRK